MAGVWKRDGTVAVTNGSKKVTGTGTTFADAKNGVAKGHLFCMTTGTTVDLYEVDYVVSNTELHLVQAFRGTTGTGKAYEIITTFSDSIPEFARKLNASLSYYQSQSDMVQQLFTSDAAEITVTAPDGTTHKLIPWKRVTSEGEGQAARAKVEADKAAASAALATDVVRDSAMPLPDVWSPLVDSLRLVTGKGKEIKVGEDVVARRWEFERLSAATERQKDGKLRLVPAGEPRYEGGALVKERGSTNLYFPHDASVGCTPVGGAAAMSAGSGLLGETQTLKFSEDSTNGSHYLWLRTTGAVTVGDSVSVSVELIVHKAAFNKIRIGCNEMSGADRVTLSVTPDLIGKPQLLTFTGTANAATLRPYVWGMVADSPSWQGDGSLNFEILSVQVEKGPPTSLIPTTTAAATRAAESVWLPGPANSAGYGKSRTYAFEFEIISPSTSGYVPFICEGAYPTRTLITVWNDGNLQANNDYVRATMSSPVFKKRNVISATFDYDGGYVMLSLNGSPVVKSPVVCTVKPGQAEIAYEKLEIGALGGGGHQSSIRIRNFRQWNRPSPEAQLRAIK
ncbi:phage head spike fiber domain-containing protein [Aeromonas sp. 602826]|uniref:phage head spike fiber domain-containing protein n=1 Tax=Aeromonas sp. 602826 TaxID=2712044 RepID=UPI003BA0829C